MFNTQFLKRKLLSKFNYKKNSPIFLNNQQLISTFNFQIKTQFKKLMKIQESKRELNFELYSSSNFSVGSTHLPLNFFRKSYFGGFINEKDKGNTKSLNKHQTTSINSSELAF